MSKLDQLRALGAAKRAGQSNPFEDAARGRDVAKTNPVAKATKGKAVPAGKAKGSCKTPVTPADGVASRLGAGRTAQDSPRLETAGAVAIQKRGRPRLGEVRDKPWLRCKPPMSERTWYRRKREAEKAK
jgi:hypothetical protein